MIWDTRAAAIASLREFSPWLRKLYRIIPFWSTTHGRTRYCRVLTLGGKAAS